MEISGKRRRRRLPLNRGSAWNGEDNHQAEVAECRGLDPSFPSSPWNDSHSGETVDGFCEGKSCCVEDDTDDDVVDDADPEE